MAGRSRHPIPLHALARGPPPSIEDPRLHPHHRLAALEDRLAAQQRDLNTLLMDNEHLANDHVALNRDLTALRRERLVIADSAARTKADRDAEVRDLYERSLRAEAEVGRVDAMKAELTMVRSDVGKLEKDRDDLVQRLEGIKAEMGKSRGDMGRIEEVKAEIAFMRREIEKGRAAVEYEKKTHAENLEQSQSMEKNIISMAREVEKLRAELANAEKRARAAAAAAAAARPGPAYAENYGNNAMPYGGSTYTEQYGYHQGQRGVDAVPQYGAGALSRGPYDYQQTHVPR